MRIAAVADSRFPAGAKSFSLATSTPDSALAVPGKKTLTMKINLLRCPHVAAALVLAAVLGCRPAPEGDPQDKLPISGKPSDAPVELKAQWRPGYRYLVLAQTAQTSTGSFRRGPSSMESTLAQDYAITVSEGQRGGRSLDLQFKSLAVTMYFGDQLAVFYDSQNSVTTPVGDGVQSLDGLLDARITVQLKRDGSVSALDGVRELLDKASGGDAGRSRGLGTVMRFISPAYFRQFVEFGGLPAKPVKVGESWSAQRDVAGNMIGMLVMHTTNTFVGWQERHKRSCARIAITGQITLPTQANRSMAGDVSVTDGQVKGTLWLDPKLEFPVELALEQNYTVTGAQPSRGPRRGRTSAPPGGGVAGGKVSLPVHQTLLFKLTEAQAGPDTPGQPPPP
jgi:hypothetical protein